MRGVRFAIVVFIGLVVAIVWSDHCSSESRSADTGSLERTPTGDPGTAGVFRRSLPEDVLRLITIIDHRTRKQILTPIELVMGDTWSMPLLSGQEVLTPILSNESRLRYPLFDGATHEVNALEHICQSESAWDIGLPFSAECRIQVAQELQPLLAKGGVIALFRAPPRGLEPGIEFNANDGMFPINQNTRTLAGLMNYWGKAFGHEVLVENKIEGGEIPPIILPLRGTYVVGVFLQEGTAGYEYAAMMPGELNNVFVPLQSRPVFDGVLLDWNGEPVPNASITWTVLLDLENYDLMPSDARVGLIGYRRDGVVYHVVKRTIITDDAGRFTARLPRGVEYSFQSCARNGWGFWNSAGHSQPVNSTYTIVLNLEQPSATASVVFRIVTEGGLSLSGGSAVPMIAGDFPYFRTFGELPLGSNGTFSVTGPLPGDRVTAHVYHPTLKNGFYGPQSVVVPTSKEVLLVIPYSVIEESSE